MPHVMVPCPEEHLAEFTVGLMRMSLDLGGGWSDEAIRTFAQTLRPGARALVVAVATRSVDLDRLAYTEAATLLEVSVGEVLLAVTEINEECRRGSVPGLLITETKTQIEPDGEQRGVPVLVIVRSVAERLLATLRQAETRDNDEGQGAPRLPVDGDAGQVQPRGSEDGT